MTSHSEYEPRGDGPNAGGQEFEIPSYDHVMIDIETMSLSPHNALILSVGMIEFDPEPINQLCIGSKSLIVMNIEQQLALGREVSKSTQDWWLKQDPKARVHWSYPDFPQIHVATALDLIRKFCAGKSRVWANGTQFDLSNLVGLNKQWAANGTVMETNAVDLWHYQAPRDMRTFCRETPATRLVPIGDALDIPGVPHDPVYDCIMQAYQVWSHWSHV